MFQEYKIIFLYALICLLFVLVLLIACYLFSYSTTSRAENFEKVSAYECGFEPFEEARLPFDIHYYMVAILFLIFDLEIAFLLPWTVSFGVIGFANVYIMVFVIILTLGFIFEWKMGALTWVKVTKRTDDIDTGFNTFKNISI